MSNHRGMLVLLISAGILNYADRQIIALLKPMLTTEFGWTDANYGQLVAVFQFAAAVAFLFAGYFVDRVGARWANPLAVGSWSLAAIAHAVVSTMPQFFAVRAALGATEALGTPTAVKTIAAAFAARDRTAALGTMNAAGSVGAILAPLAIPPIAAALGWRATFMITGGAGLLWVCAWFIATRRIQWQDESAAEPEPAKGYAPWREALSDRRTWAIAGAKALSDQVWWFLLYWTPDLFHRVFHLGLTATALPLAAIYLAAAVGSVLGGWGFGWLLRRNGSDFYRARLRVFLICGVCVLPVPLVLHVSGIWLAVALLGLTLAAHQGFSANLFALITDIIPSPRIGLVTGIGAVSGNLAGMIIVQAVGETLSRGGGYMPIFLWIAVAYLLALAWIRVLLPVRRFGLVRQPA